MQLVSGRNETPERPVINMSDVKRKQKEEDVLHAK